MKLIFFLITSVFSFLTLITAQSPPNAFNYGAVARDFEGNPLSNEAIGIQISIIKNSPTGISQYSENHFVTTDTNGLFNLVVGAGAIQSGSITSIDWSNDNYFLKVGIDTTGGTNYLEMGITQLLSVPYALYAKRAGSISSENTNSHFIGESFGGGVIFHLWKDGQGVEHGLIVDKNDLSIAEVWSNIFDTLIGNSAQSYWDGNGNTNSIVTQIGHTISAAALCLNSTNGGFNDWYLPALDELDLLNKKLFEVNMSLRSINGATEIVMSLDGYYPEYYWSSTELITNKALCYNFGYDTLNIIEKFETAYVRAIRAF